MVVGPVVVFRPGALGDTIVTADALWALGQACAPSSIELVGNLAAGALLAQAGLVDRVTSFDAAEVAALFAPRPRLLPRWREASAAVVWLRSGDAIVRAFRNAGVDRIIVTPPEPTDAQTHISEHLVSTLQTLTAGAGPSTPVLLDGLCQRAAPTPAGRGRALIHPGSGSLRKNWPPAQFAALAQQLAMSGWQVAILNGPADVGATLALRAALGSELAPLVSPSDLGGLVRVLCGAAVMVGNDSGVSHLSARLGIPTVAVFGASAPHRWAPRGPRVRVVGGGGAWPALDAVVAAVHELANGAMP